uniref:DUF4142 domain-containing protein n=1 Tax=Pseudo-nitzschia multistriata TaxID=183589 RepID=A0A448YZ72_9STRA
MSNSRIALFGISLVLLSTVLATGIEALSFSDLPVRESTKNHLHSRRHFVGMASAFVAAAPLVSVPAVSYAVQEGNAKERFVAARKELRSLIDDYAEISKGGGDAVRARLGTQGISSDLFGIQKVLKTLSEEADDLVEYTEMMEEFDAYYFQAEGAAYQSMFVEHSSAKGTPESFLKTAKTDILQMEKYMDQLAVQLKL